ncbi:MAG: hypothetical protein CMJ45_01495 [Planctomyces sp.]|nr:hypothetical protein [Planctomyces sp.]
MQDRFGLPISTTSTVAADHFGQGVDLVLSRNYGPEEHFRQALEADEGFALAHCAQAHISMLRGRGSEARESADKAKSLSSGISERERSQIEAIHLWVNGKGPQSLAVILEHMKEFPRNAMLLSLSQRLYMLGCSGAGVPDFPGHLFNLCQSVEKHCTDDWSFLSQFSFAHHETGKLDEALRLSEQSLEMYPSNGVASHSVAHAYFEMGDASSGGDFLGKWLDGYDKRGPSTVHLSWHQALFQLAMGRYQDALDLYESGVRPTVVEKGSTALNDSASLMWRWQMYTKAAAPAPWEEVCVIAASAADSPGPAFRDAHAALAFASGDPEAFQRLKDRLGEAANAGNPLAAEVTLPLVQGIGAFAEGNYSESAAKMEPLAHQFARIGGSHAQREVFEDTLLEAYLRSDQVEKAEVMLRERLGRRPSYRDTFWMGRAQVSAGETVQATSTLQNAIDGWKGGDENSQELANLTELAESLS